MPSAVFSVIGYCVPAKKGTVKHRGKLQLKFLRLDAKIKNDGIVKSRIQSSFVISNRPEWDVF